MRRNKRPVKGKRLKPIITHYTNSDDHFALTFGYTSGGAAYGLTHEEWEVVCYQSEMEPIYTEEMNLDSVHDENYHPDEFYTLSVISIETPF